MSARLPSATNYSKMGLACGVVLAYSSSAKSINGMQQADHAYACGHKMLQASRPPGCHADVRLGL